jgi:hypothetical protein
MKIKELFSNPGRWTQYASAETSLQIPCHPYESQAVAFCFLGAISRCYAEDEDEERAIIRKVTLEIGGGPISWWNDHPDRTFEEVKALAERLDI